MKLLATWYVRTILLLILTGTAVLADAQTVVINFAEQATHRTVSLGPVDKLATATQSQFSVELWFKAESFNEQAIVIATLDDGGEWLSGWGLVTRDNNTVDFLLSTHSNTTYRLSSRQSGGASRCAKLDTQKWYHLGATFSKNDGQMSIYLDGILCNQLSTEKQNIYYNNTAQLRLAGPEKSQDGRSFQGQMSEVRIWTNNREQSQLREVMSTRIEGQSNLLANWRLNEGSASEIRDTVGTFEPAQFNFNNPWSETYLPLDGYTPEQPICHKVHCGWHTQGRQILDPSGKPFKIKAINWFGFQSKTNLVHGLWDVDFIQQLNKIKALGFNTVRLPFSNSTLLPDAKVDTYIEPLPGNALFYQGMPALEALDTFINAARLSGLYVILDRHKLTSDADNPELWYSEQVSETKWIEDWRALAQRYRDEPAIIGADIHNEPNGIATWGNGQVLTDWRMAAQKAGNAILSVNPDWLIFVEGVDWSDDFFVNERIFEGGVAQYPVEFHTANKVVYSPHEYGPNYSGYRHRWFYKGITFEEAAKVWDSTWGYIVDNAIAPVFVGEFGGRFVDVNDSQLLANYPNEADEVPLTQGDAAIWFSYIVRYLKTKDVDFGYWGWTPNSINTGGLLDDNWKVIREKVVAINPIMNVPLSLQTGVDNYFVPERQASWLNVLSNDSSNYSELSILSISEPGMGVIAFNGGRLYYTPFGNACGSDNFNYRVSDGLLEESVLVNLTIELDDDRDRDCVRDDDDRWPDDSRYAFDNDVDNLPDNWEMAFFGTIDAVTALMDSDGDGLSNIQEWMDGTDPTDNYSGGTDNDSDGDSMTDSWEVMTFGTISRDGNGDFDHDGYTDAQEFAFGLDPLYNPAVLIPIVQLILKDKAVATKLLQPTP